MSKEYTEESTIQELLDYLAQDCEWAAELVRERLIMLDAENSMLKSTSPVCVGYVTESDRNYILRASRYIKIKVKRDAGENSIPIYLDPLPCHPTTEKVK